jgi:glucoamylase
MWAHAEYVKLLRSAHDGQLFDLVPEVAQRYLKGRVAREPVEIWKFNRRAPTVKRGRTLRIQAPAAFRLHWTRDGWQTRDDTVSTSTSLGIEYVDISVPVRQQAPVRFTFFWTAKGRWEGRDYEVATVARAS